ncbi:unnamed protein product [Rotaria sordida]|uniref:Uncharacterized protein n=1 Tax=Rotaria sordida TaxID=392033 RepID=A0A813ZZU8_9BILA|nr:unnamed protein product [Rotaria sordida]CAF3591167.1 unnamed protein product [Rotaria sordida]
MNLLASYFVSCERERNRLRAQKTIEITPNMILFKLDDQGNGKLFERTKVDSKKEFSLDTFEKFREICDYTSLAFQYEIGNLNVKTKHIVGNFHPSKWEYHSLGSSSFIPGHLQSIWSKEYAVRSVLFSLTSTQINQQTFSTSSPPRKIRSKSDS